jgi:hypothetical protein
MAEERIFSFLFTVLRYPVLLLLKNLLHVFLVFIGHKGCSWIKLLAPSLKATKISHFPLCHFLLLSGQTRDTVKEENKEEGNVSFTTLI